MSDLDEWFARCDDVLDNWHGGTDAMLCEPSKGEVDLPRGDSYYDQRTYWRPERVPRPWTVEVQTAQGWQHIGGRSFDQMRSAFAEMVRAFNEASATVWDEMQTIADTETNHESPRDHALRLRRERNTGPAAVRGMDGRRRG